MKFSTLDFNLAGISIATLLFSLPVLPAKSLTIGSPIKGGIVNKGTENGLLNQSDSEMGKGFGKSFKDDYIILGAKNNHLANDANNTGTNNNRYLIPFTLNINDLQKEKQTFSFDLAFNGSIGGTRTRNSADFLVVQVYEGATNGELRRNVGIFLERYADKTEELIPKAFSFTPSLQSNDFRANANYFLGFRLREYGFGNATRNTVVGIDTVKINDVTIPNNVPVPEPLTLLGAGTASFFGTFFKRKLNHFKSAKKQATKIS